MCLGHSDSLPVHFVCELTLIGGFLWGFSGALRLGLSRGVSFACARACVPCPQHTATPGVGWSSHGPPGAPVHLIYNPRMDRMVWGFKNSGEMFLPLLLKMANSQSMGSDFSSFI